MNNFWNVAGAVLACFVFGAYLVVLFAVFADLFRDHRASGWAKALWIVFLLVVPVASTLIYVIIKGDAMARRSHAAYEHLEHDFDRIRHEEQDFAARSARGSRAHQIDQAKQLLAAGLITEAEFEQRKQHALR
ncbi:SHOCT domain-containing protein [Rhodococcus sp. SGAir0479]|uniref:SHOCT domain-containing protein n=1 Tax=Rhodococcus sp. SGAir0479 TaxID=2567884 RepID=UPI0010CCEA4E|nr:SHOCT domain-containing protein [Rhodococcus sp. SGAir0479]QCQ90427.1 hypothetical protein E7742_03785 [Rhodococcus sp. SGAir0479]